MIKENVLDLENFFQKEYNYTFKDFADLLSQPFIKYEGTGKFAIFWIKINNQEYLFKRIEDNDYTWLGELLSKEIADILEIPCAEYTLCKLDNKLGILSKKFTKKNESIILGAQIIQEALDKYPYLKAKYLLDDKDFLTSYNIPEDILAMERKYKVRYLHNNLNNLEQLWSLIPIYLELNHLDKKYTTKIMEYLVNMFMFDVLTMQADRHIGNWGIIINQDTNEISTSYLFDNSASFGIGDKELEERIQIFYQALNSYQNNKSEKEKKKFLNTFYKNRLLLTPSEDAIKSAKLRKRENNIEVMDYFLRVSSEECIALFQEKLNKLKNTSIASLLEKIEIEQKISIPNNIKQYLIDTIYLNLYLLEEKINTYQIKQGCGRNE